MSEWIVPGQKDRIPGQTLDAWISELNRWSPSWARHKGREYARRQLGVTVDEMPVVTAIAYIEKHYGGGWQAFVNDEKPATPDPQPDLRSLLSRFERVWDCEVFRTGYHNGDTCAPGEPHGGWNCGFVWKFPLLTDAGARRIGLTTDSTKED
jgi:hypothetical protein